MNYRGKFLLATISAGIALYAVIGGFLGTRAQQPINDVGAQIRIFESVLQHIQNDYVDEPDLEKVRAGALRGLPYGLDPYSSYLTEEQVRQYQANTHSKKAGIGAEFSQIASYLYVISVRKGSPADTAGLRSGDVIEYVGGKATRDISLYDAREMILGESGTKVDLRVLRSGAKPQTISVVRGNFKVPTAETRTEAGKIAVVKVNSLDAGESNDIRGQIQSLLKQDVSKIVLDLRGVAGGDLNEGVDVANIFIKEGTIGQVIGREEKVIQTFQADPAKFLFGGDVAVLIDSGTAGPAEVVASAILERKRGEVVGEKSFGAGTKQELFPLTRGGGLLLTTAKWASASGETFLGKDRATSGVKPSVEVKWPEAPEAIEVEDLVQRQDEDETPPPAEKPTPKTSRPGETPEDLPLKKALEILRAKAATANG